MLKSDLSVFSILLLQSEIVCRVTGCVRYLPQASINHIYYHNFGGICSERAYKNIVLGIFNNEVLAIIEGMGKINVHLKNIDFCTNCLSDL